MCLVGIDGDMILYNSAFAAQHMWYNVYPKGWAEKKDRLIERCESSKAMKEFVKGLGKKEEDFDIVPELEVKEPFKAKLIADQTIAKIFRRTGATEAVFLLSDSKNFRHELAVTQPYKDRDKTKPHHYELVKEYLVANYGAVVVKDLEADDAIGILSEHCGEADVPFVLSSYDKDLNQIPGLHYDFNKDILYNVTEWDSILFFFTQVLTGDSTDSIPGLPGVGKVRAEKLLTPCKTYDEMLEVVKHAYMNHTIGTKKNKDIRPMFDKAAEALQYLNEQANLVYIRRDRNVGVNIT